MLRSPAVLAGPVSIGRYLYSRFDLQNPADRLRPATRVILLAITGSSLGNVRRCSKCCERGPQQRFPQARNRASEIAPCQLTRINCPTPQASLTDKCRNTVARRYPLPRLYPLCVWNLGRESNHADISMAPTGDFQFNDFNNFPGSFTDPSLPSAPLQPGQPLYASSPAAGSPTSAVAPPSGTKRKSDSISTSPSEAQSFEEASRLAAEEDKRRRNTAASARFRVKKKQREQALERSAKEMGDKVAALEGRINQLETENKWLKNLITEKNDSKEDIAALWKKFNAENEQRKGSERKSGVGTKA
jgi:Basic region leucine zipper